MSLDLRSQIRLDVHGCTLGLPQRAVQTLLAAQEDSPVHVQSGGDM
jgi:hypothetical protein